MKLGHALLISALCMTSATSFALSRRKPTVEQIQAMQVGEVQLQKSLRKYRFASPQALQSARTLSEQYLQLSRHTEAGWALEAAGDFENGQRLMRQVEDHLQNLPIINLSIPQGLTSSNGRKGFIADLHTVLVKSDSPQLVGDIRLERWAYLLDRLFGFNLVPPTVLRIVEGRISSVQYWIHDSAPSEIDLRKGGYKDVPPELYILDFLIMNADRHGANSLRRLGGKWVAIDPDHGNTGLLETEKDKARHSLLLSKLPQQLVQFDSSIRFPPYLKQRILNLTLEEFNSALIEIPEASRRHLWSRLDEIRSGIKAQPRECGGWLQRLLSVF